MRAILEFNLPEDDYEFNCARNGTKYKQVISEVFNRLRRLDKIDCPHLTIQEVRDLINQEREEAGVFNDD
jgi:hypothetical protein